MEPRAPTSRRRLRRPRAGDRVQIRASSVEATIRYILHTTGGIVYYSLHFEGYPDLPKSTDKGYAEDKICALIVRPVAARRS